MTANRSRRPTLCHKIFSKRLILACLLFGLWGCGLNRRPATDTFYLPVRLAELEADAVDLDQVISLIGFLPCSHMASSAMSSSSQPAVYYAPVYSAEFDVEPVAENLRTIVEVREAKGEQDVSMTLRGGQLKGRIVPLGDQLNHALRVQLMQDYPGIDLDKCRIFQID